MVTLLSNHQEPGQLLPLLCGSESSRIYIYLTSMVPMDPVIPHGLLTGTQLVDVEEVGVVTEFRPPILSRQQ